MKPASRWPHLAAALATGTALVLPLGGRASAQATTPIFTYYGRVFLPDGQPLAGGGYEVVVTTRILRQILVAPLGAQEPGTYSVTAFDLQGSRAAVEGDSAKIELREVGGVAIAPATHIELQASDIAAQRRRVDLSTARVEFMLVAPVPRPIPVGENVDLVFQVLNFGNASDSYDIVVTSTHPEWISSPPTSVGPIAPDESAGIVITLNVPPGTVFQEEISVRLCSRLRPSACQIATTSTRDLPVDSSGLPAWGAVLHQNHPNPFNPSTRIDFELPEATPVTLRILDSRGRTVRTLVDRQTLPGGRHSRVWNGQNDASRPVASGVYHCRLTTSFGSFTRRMALVR